MKCVWGLLHPITIVSGFYRRGSQDVGHVALGKSSSWPYCLKIINPVYPRMARQAVGRAHRKILNFSISPTDKRVMGRECENLWSSTFSFRDLFLTRKHLQFHVHFRRVYQDIILFYRVCRKFVQSFQILV